MHEHVVFICGCDQLIRQFGDGIPSLAVSSVLAVFISQDSSTLRLVDSKLTDFFNQHGTDSNKPELAIQFLRVCFTLIADDSPVPPVASQEWYFLLSHPMSDEWSSHVAAFLDKHPSKVHALAECRDVQGRQAIDGAGSACRAVMQQRLQELLKPTRNRSKLHCHP